MTKVKENKNYIYKTEKSKQDTITKEQNDNYNFERKQYIAKLKAR